MTTALTPQDIAAIERATLAAVPPDALEALPGWLLGLDHGTVGRAHSAVPLHHGATDPQVLPAIEARYAAHGLRPVFRIPDTPALQSLRDALQGRGYAPSQPTVCQTGTVAAMAALALPDGPGMVQLERAPGDAWASVYLGAGFDPVDGASRVRLLGRAAQAVFARVEVQGQAVASGAASFSDGWASVHGMRTLPAWRGRGLARRILVTLAQEARERGFARVFLQVEAGNTGARALYARAGFRTAWGYAYWRR